MSGVVSAPAAPLTPIAPFVSFAKTSPFPIHIDGSTARATALRTTRRAEPQRLRKRHRASQSLARAGAGYAPAKPRQSIASSIARLHSIALIKVMPMIPAIESVRENPSGARPTLRSMTDSHRLCAVRPSTSMCLSAISNVKITSSGRCSILSAADMRLQVSVHETPSTSDTLMNVLSAILSMAPVAEAPSSRAGSARTTAKPRGAKRRYKSRAQPARGAHRDQHQRDSRHQHEVQRALCQTHA